MKSFSIGELAIATGVTTQAVRYYEQQELMLMPRRTESNYRRYPQEAVARLQFIVHAKQWGFTLEEIRELLWLQDANGDRAEAKRIAGEKLGRIREQIESLRRIEAVLAKTFDECSGEGAVAGCPIVEAIADQS
jgi:MerR family mercuric resistance operon transcriptional regulator